MASRPSPKGEPPNPAHPEGTFAAKRRREFARQRTSASEQAREGGWLARRARRHASMPLLMPLRLSLRERSDGSTLDLTYSFRYRRYAKALYSALKDDPFYATMEEKASILEDSRASMLRYLDFSMVEAKEYGELFIPEHEYGVAIWSKPLSAEREAIRRFEKTQFLTAHLGETAKRTYHDIVEFMSSESTTLIDHRFWYLSIIGILPAFQNQGLGTSLVNGVLSTADRLGVPTYLETFTPRNQPFYQRLGYRVADAFYEPTTQSRYALMIRAPGGA